MSDNDQAAAILAGIMSTFGECAEVHPEKQLPMATFILDAIRAGKVPLPEDAPQIAKLRAEVGTLSEYAPPGHPLHSCGGPQEACMQPGCTECGMPTMEQALAMRAEVERLSNALYDAGKRGDAYMEGMDQARRERDEAAEEYQEIHEQVAQRCYRALESAGITEQPDGGGQPDYILPSIVEISLSRIMDLVAAHKDRAEKAERERDEARAALAIERQHRDGHLPSCAGVNLEEGRCGCGYLDGTAYRNLTERLECLVKPPERLEQAMDLLREARKWATKLGLDSGPRCECADCGTLRKIDVLLAGHPAPVKPLVDAAMVERARKGEA